MKRQMKVAIGSLLVILVIIFGVLRLVQSLIDTGVANYSPPPVTISAESVKTENWDIYIKSVGSITAVNGVDITSEVGGLIQEIYFASGIDVTEDQVLVQLDDTVEKANLRSYAAQLKLAKINFDRDKRLLSSNAISKTDFDTVEAKMIDAEAQVDRTKALIQQKKIRAPFSGRLGIRQLNVGDFVKTGDPLVTLQSLDYLHVDFYVPEQYFPKLVLGQRVHFTVQAFPDRIFDAKVSAINAKVDQNTRNIQVRATFNNDAQELLPGMFTNIQVVLEQQKSLVTVPQTAISYSLYGDSVFVVVEESSATGDVIKRVDRRYIKILERRDQRVAIVDGLEAGELVVSSGDLKLNNGSKVNIDNSVEL
ncbi:efflux RND transporter periplasmic adaptor subunit [Oceanicoccus sp. KOV_DT_Chl]|uniref:efflux RND transporter periplasmic adaptor subunit n=1 Tax=Oceanicoccus sp. KOV_DT_Chl TaxID=1904639 RepID=UPI000C7C96F5|nr:efflux RND transporter periplasmic adaptor subunit [Oceanicoccus sp. KOV_DT_Chl]